MRQLWQTVRSAQSHTPHLRIRQVHLEHGAHLEARDNDQKTFCGCSQEGSLLQTQSVSRAGARTSGM